MPPAEAFDLEEEEEAEEQSQVYLETRIYILKF